MVARGWARDPYSLEPPTAVILMDERNQWLKFIIVMCPERMLGITSKIQGCLFQDGRQRFESRRCQVDKILLKPMLIFQIVIKSSV